MMCNPQKIGCHNCGKGAEGDGPADRLYGWIEVRKVALTGYYQERTDHELTVFCSMDCLRSYHFGVALGVKE